MRFIFKTSYDQDIRLAQHGGHVFWYGLLMLLLITAPGWLEEYWLAQLTFVLIYSIMGLGLMVLAGFTGLFSIGNAAFMGVGAYVAAVLSAHSVPFPLTLALAAGLSAIVGAVVGLPALRVKGIFLGIATLSFGFIVEEALARWESVTGGNAGKHVKTMVMGPWAVDSAESFYAVCLGVTVLCTLGVLNLLRSASSTSEHPPCIHSDARERDRVTADDERSLSHEAASPASARRAARASSSPRSSMASSMAITR